MAIPAEFDRLVAGAPSAALAAALDNEWKQSPASDIVRHGLRLLAGRIALVSSFGAESVVLLHMVAEADRRTPVIFIDTRRLFPETLTYRDALVARLGFSDVRSVGPTAAAAAQYDAAGTLAGIDPDACCSFRKIAPLEQALAPFSAWFTGRRRSQSVTRADLPIVEWDGKRIKLNPLAAWSSAQIEEYRRCHALPTHPLALEGYPSIGCAPCTARVSPGEDERAGRWRGFEKTECGIHNRRLAAVTEKL